MIYLAFYKHKRETTGLKNLWYRFFDEAIRLATRGKYSHCEVAALREDGLYDCYSSSARDGGVRKKVMSLPFEKWDLNPVDCEISQITAYFDKTKYSKYDYLGAGGLVLPFTQNRGRYFCSEWCFNAVFNSKDGWRFSPNQLSCLIIS